MPRFILLAMAFIPAVACARPFAVLDAQNRVTNIIEADSAAALATIYPNAVALAAPGGIGSTYDQTARTFSNPVSGTESQKWITATDFELRFTQSERIALRASTDPIVRDFLDLLSVTPSVNLRDPVTAGGVRYLESSGLIATGRAAQILQ